MKIRQVISNIIDIAAVSTTPVAAWVAIGQAIHKPWAHSGFIVLWGVSAGAWMVRVLIRAKKKNALRQQEHSSKKMKKKKNNNNSITENRRKSNSMLKEYFAKNTPWLREGKGFANKYEKRDIMIQPNLRR